MSLSVGIVGLPNVGKSTLFNALLKKQQALAANYPFATIEPNTGIVEVPDHRLKYLAQVIAGEKIQKNKIEVQNQDNWPPIKPATIEFVDIAGLVAGASKGEGLGNQFLSHIREVNVICHVLRAFEDGDVVLTGTMNPIDDLKTVRMELILKDIDSINKKLLSSKSEIRINPKLGEVLNKLLLGLSAEQRPNDFLSPAEIELIRDLQLLTMKPEIFVINIGENELTQALAPKYIDDIAAQLQVDHSDIVVISAKIEAELSELEPIEQQMYLSDLGLKQSGIERMAQVAYHKLGLISFLTAGEIEVKAWTIATGTKAPQAAGVIHTDFEKKFIKADVVNWQDFVNCEGWKIAREQGKVRLEGREYVMQDGDVVEFKIGS